MELVVAGCLISRPMCGSVGHDAGLWNELGAKSTVLDYGCGLVAGLAGLMFVASVIGGTLALLSGGVSFGLIVGVGFNVLFWF